MVAGSSFPEAAELASNLWKSKYSNKIFISGNFSCKDSKFKGPRSKNKIYNKDYKSEYEFYKDVLKINGVNEESILGENQSMFTRQNAEFARERLDSMKIRVKQMILICKSFHARRCYSFYQSEFPECRILVVPFDAYNINYKNWYLSEYGVERVLNELKSLGEQMKFSDIIKSIM